MKRITAMVVCLSFVCLAALTASSSNTEAAPVAERLVPNTVLLNEMFVFGNDPDDILNMITNHGTLAIGNGDDSETDLGEWDGDPGALHWANATQGVQGTYGMATLKVGLSDLAESELSDYYTVHISALWTTRSGLPSTAWTTISSQGAGISSRVGLGYSGAETGDYEYINATYTNAGGGIGNNILTKIYCRNEVYARPFTADEIDNLYAIVQLRFDAGNIAYCNPGTLVNLWLGMVDVQVNPVSYTPETIPSGSFILRPNGGANYSSYMTPYPVTERFAAVNETPYFGDADTSYLYSLWANKTSVPLTFTDTPSWANAAGYSAILWVVARETLDTAYEELAIALHGSNGKLSFTEKHDIQVAYTNQTLSVPTNPGTNISWTLDELDAITASFIARYDDPDNIPTGDCRITQVAILCVPTSYTPPDVDFGGTQEWLATGGGIMTMFAAFGFIGLCATPVIAIFMFKEQDQGVLYTVAMTIFMGTMFFFMFWFGIS